MLKNTTKYFTLSLFIFLHFSVSANNSDKRKKKGKSIFNFRLTDVTDNFLGNAIETVIEIHKKIKKTKEDLFNEHQTKIDTLLKELNKLRDIYYQYHVVQTARKLEGKNLYHHYGKRGKNAEDNTCVVGWCVAMSETRHPRFRHLTTDKIKLLPLTLEEEEDKLDEEKPYNPYYYSAKKKKIRSNLKQKRAKYINVQEIVDLAEDLGFVPIDLDLTQTGDFVVQYYKKPRLDMIFGPQHISIVHQVIHYNNGKFELRDWHEGIEDLPFVYRTGHNLESSHNNIFYPENVYYGFQTDVGKPRKLKGRNPNVCQGYAYFGENTEKAKKIIHRINQIRGSLYINQKLFSFLGILGV